jgi:hypothetical protein
MTRIMYAAITTAMLGCAAGGAQSQANCTERAKEDLQACKEEAGPNFRERAAMNGNTVLAGYTAEQVKARQAQCDTEYEQAKAACPPQ